MVGRDSQQSNDGIAWLSAISILQSSSCTLLQTAAPWAPIYMRTALQFTGEGHVL